MDKTTKQKQSKAINKEMYCLQEIFHKKSSEYSGLQANTTSQIFTQDKYHSPAKQRRLRPIKAYIEGQSPTSLGYVLS